MTKKEFLPGWTLLIVQPWGWRYNQVGHDGKPTPDALTQLDFYYDKLKFGDMKAWAQTAELYAQGREWPCLNDVRQTLSMFHRRIHDQLPAPTSEVVEMPEEVRQKIQAIVKMKGMPA